jgi:hypothetical protein
VSNNRLSGTVPSTISALTAITYLYAANPGRAPADAAHASQRERVVAHERLCSIRPHASLCVIRFVSHNSFTGPIPASIMALTKLVSLYAPPPPCGLPTDSGV